MNLKFLNVAATSVRRSSRKRSVGTPRQAFSNGLFQKIFEFTGQELKKRQESKVGTRNGIQKNKQYKRMRQPSESGSEASSGTQFDSPRAQSTLKNLNVKSAHKRPDRNQTKRIKKERTPNAREYSEPINMAKSNFFSNRFHSDFDSKFKRINSNPEFPEFPELDVKNVRAETNLDKTVTKPAPKTPTRAQKLKTNEGSRNEREQIQMNPSERSHKGNVGENSQKPGMH